MPTTTSPITSGTFSSGTFNFTMTGPMSWYTKGGLLVVSGGSIQTNDGAGGGSGFVPNSGFGVTYSGSFADGQSMTVNIPGGGLGARANPLPLYYWPMGEDGSTTFATHATLSRTAKTLTGSLGSAVIQSSVTPPNALGACKYIPTTSSPGHTAFSDSPMWSLTGGTGSHAYLFMKRNWAFSAAPGNVKLWRLWNGATTHSVMFLTQTPSTEWGCGIDGNVLTTGIAHPTFFVAGSLSWPGLNQWNTDEWFWQEPTQNTYDGIHQWARQAEMAYEMAGRFNCLGSDSLMGPGPLVNGYWEEYTPINGIPNGTTDLAYYGIMYVDDSWLQLIVTDEGPSYQTAYIYTSPTPYNREIQLQTARSDTSITFVVRKGSHASLTGKHLLAVTGYGTAIDLGVGA